MSVIVHQIARPDGVPTADHFRTFHVPTPQPHDGQALVENLYLSVDPYMREMMDFAELDAPMEGRTIGRVTASRNPELPVGQLVHHRAGWRSHAVLRPDEVRLLAPADGVPLSAYLGILGATGLTAYTGLTRIARLQPGETVYVSAAAGAVGSAAGQIARLLGAGRVIGSTGSTAKAAYLVDKLGFDAALNYRDGDLAAQLAEAAPDGIDVYFDNVGGDHLEAALGVLRDRGRIAWCGAISQYNSTVPPAAPRNLYQVVDRQLRLEGFLVRDHLDLRPEFEQFLTPYVRSGRVPTDETVVDGVEHMVEAFLSMLGGGNLGKMIVRA